ncbi:prolyl oligopeptidase family serine peptidase [Bacillus sp. NP157]|nr:prolyl oligopeptidase family serine peptidase [Bacillus sp. NP157]
MKRLIGLLFALVATAAMATPPGHFEERAAKIEGVDYRYQVFVPGGLSPSSHPPIVLFLHGSGEKGEDNKAQMSQGLPPWLKEHLDFPAVVVMPQAHPQQSWRHNTVASAALAILRTSMAEFHADPKQVYVTGLSDGGFGAWKLGAEHPGEFAGLVIICGGVFSTWDGQAYTAIWGAPAHDGPQALFDWVAGKVKGTPVWLFHGADDGTVPPEQSRQMHAALERIGSPVRYTEYPGVGHGSWQKAYATPNLWPFYHPPQL